MKECLSILYVAYPLLAVTAASAGGAEQMLLALEHEMVRDRHRTMVAAARGSSVSGTLLATGEAASIADQYEAREREHHERILEHLQQHSDDFDLIHDESGSFFRRAAECRVPVLATLHLPRHFYRREWFSEIPCNLYFNCVSQSQAKTFLGVPNLLGVVSNGIAVEDFPFSGHKQDYLLWLGRICEEKGPHLAIAAAQRAGLPLVLAGQVYPFRYHHEYFKREIRPHLHPRSGVRFIDTPSREHKLELLRHARALLLTSTVDETSSLVAMEATACGTPVVAFRRGAFPEVVAEDLTGLLVDSVDEMAAVVEQTSQISPEACRAHAEAKFKAARMAHDYEQLYQWILATNRQCLAA